VTRWGDFKFESKADATMLTFEKYRKKGMQAIAIEVAGAARKRTPVDTGRLRASIAWAVSGRKEHRGSWKGTVVQYTAQSPRGEARVGTNVEYGPWVHENLDAFHKTGEAKFLENAFKEKASRAKELMLLALKGLL